MNVLVPLSHSRTIDSTVVDAVDRLLAADDCAPDESAETRAGTVHLVYTETSGRDRSELEAVWSLFDRTAAVARERAGDAATVRTARIAEERYLMTPHDHAAALADYAREHAVDLVVLDPRYSVDATDPILQPVDHAFDRAGLRYVYADVPATRRPSADEIVRFSTTAAIAFGFFVAVGVFYDATELALGVLAGVAAGLLFRNVTFETTPSIRRAVPIVLRGVLFVPHLLWKILTANVQISYLVLHPDLPVDPHLDRVDSAVGDGISIAGLANSLTLTPGTLTVDADRSEFLVHSLTPGTRLEVLSGERERAVRRVFYGWAAAEHPGPLDRGDVETVTGPTDAHTFDETDDGSETKNGRDRDE